MDGQTLVMLELRGSSPQGLVRMPESQLLSLLAPTSNVPRGAPVPAPGARGATAPRTHLRLCRSRQQAVLDERLPCPWGKRPHHQASSVKKSRQGGEVANPPHRYLLTWSSPTPPCGPPSSQKHKCREAPGALTLILNACC